MRSVTIAVALVCLSTLSFAQTGSESPSPERATGGVPSNFKNGIKLNVSSLAFSNYHFVYERLLGKKLSLSAGVRFMPSKFADDLPLTRQVLEWIDEEGELREDLSKLEASGQAYTLELRYYLGSRPGARGFYIGAYGRYATFKYDYEYILDEQGFTSPSIPINGDFRGIGGGALIGLQFLLAKRVIVDFTILGGHYGKLDGNGFGRRDLSMLNDSQKRLLEEDLESIFEIGDKKYVEATATNEGMRVKVDGPFAGVRSFSLSVGIAF